MAKRKSEDTVYVDVLMEHIPLHKGLTRLKSAGDPILMEKTFRKIRGSRARCAQKLEQRLFPAAYSQLRIRRIEYAHDSLERELLWGKILLVSCADKIRPLKVSGSTGFSGLIELDQDLRRFFQPEG